MKYRPEIDGLRALAVFPVILFHAGFGLFSGGFVGVDVFFVISGYLITTIIINDIENKRFSIVNFYERRARRILPALFFVMLVCIPFAWIWMLPSQMKEFSQSLVAVSFFASNILFWTESGYFDAASEEKPLLHTWSLAVEEQYYVLFPIFLIFAWRFGKNRVFWMIVVMAAISLLLSEWGWRNSATANFYLAPTRAWELFAGSIAAFIVKSKGVNKNNALSLIGLAAIVFSIFAYDENTPFPSVYALVPVLGVVLLVLYAHKDTLVAKLLSTKVFVSVGLISYSFYLWHYPLFAFKEILWFQFGVLESSLTILVAFFLAYFSWRFVEKPFRNKRQIGAGGVLGFSIIGIISFLIFGFAGYSSEGFSKRFEYSDNNFHRNIAQQNSYCTQKYPTLNQFKNCRLSNLILDPTIALIGDSHSIVLYEALIAQYPNESIITIERTNCLPFVNDYLLNSNDCNNLQDDLYDFFDSNPQIKTVILAGYWGYLASGGFSYRGVGYRISDDITEHDASSFLKNANRFFKNVGHKTRKIYLIEDHPDIDFSPVRCTEVRMPVFRAKGSRCHMDYSSYLPRKREVDDLLFSLLRVNPNIKYVTTNRHFCDSKKCWSMANKVNLYDDGDHLTLSGAELVINDLITTINE